MGSVIVPPIKSLGKKTGLVNWINDIILKSPADTSKANWIEPFFGTGVVGFNSPVGGNHIVGDTNPYIISFYQSIQDGAVTSENARVFLEEESVRLSESADAGYAYYREVKDRFNKQHNPLDFLFLSRAAFNGMIRFNRKGEWNVPFCKNPDRFSPAYITKICNQVKAVRHIIESGKWRFCCQSFEKTIEEAQKGDIIYCDPPYFGRYTEYFNSWTEEDEKRLFDMLSASDAYFIMSTWHHDAMKVNPMIARYWDRFNVLTQDYFYRNGAKTKNRHAVTEALICNFEPSEISNTASLF